MLATLAAYPQAEAPVDDVFAGSINRFLIDIPDQYLGPAQNGVLGNAATHDAGAEDADAVDVFEFHVVATSA